MTVIKNFNMDDIRKKRARMAASGGVSLVDSLAAISPDIAKLNVGDTVKIMNTVDGGLRKTVMGITAKLSNLTCKGGDWAGRSFDVASDPTDGKGAVYVQRGEDTRTPKERARGRSGGRPAAAAATPAPAAKEVTKA